METRLDFNIHSTSHLFHECTAVKTISIIMNGTIITEIYIRDTPKKNLIELTIAFLLISIIHGSFIIKNISYQNKIDKR